MSESSSFDSMNSDNEFYTCINNLEKEVNEKFQFLIEKEYIKNYNDNDNDNLKHDDNNLKHSDDNLKHSDNNLKQDDNNLKQDDNNLKHSDNNLKKSKENNFKSEMNDLESKLESLRDVKVGEINHKGKVIDVFIDRNKKKYVNYKGKRVYT